MRSILGQETDKILSSPKSNEKLLKKKTTKTVKESKTIDNTQLSLLSLEPQDLSETPKKYKTESETKTIRVIFEMKLQSNKKRSYDKKKATEEIDRRIKYWYEGRRYKPGVYYLTLEYYDKDKDSRDDAVYDFIDDMCGFAEYRYCHFTLLSVSDRDNPGYGW